MSEPTHHASPARLLALHATNTVRVRKAFAKSIIENTIDKAEVAAEERAFATLLTYGVVSCSGTLDEIIDMNLRSPKDIQPDVRDALRLSTYELIFLKKSSYACVDQGVELVRSFAPQAAGLANAVLRKIARSAADFPWGDTEKDMAALARKYGYPLWMVARIFKERGPEESMRFLEATEEPAPIFIGANPFAASDRQVEELLLSADPTTVPYGVPGCFLTTESSHVIKSDALKKGRALVSDAAAQVVARISTPVGGKPFLEVGSGRGTKTILLQGNAFRAYGVPAHIFALDVHEFKQRILEQRMGAFNIPMVEAITGDATKLDGISELPALFAGALIDAPCSGLGTLRRHPEQRWRTTQANITALAQLGTTLLSSVSERIEPGGFIVYSTCTVMREENEDVITRFLQSPQGSDYSVVSLEGQLPNEFVSCVTPEGYLRSMPQRGGADGHFAAKLRRAVR
ncbi:MAG: antitermination protein NusB [Actinobacteria bacterium]|nr:antitermination protein NusB [Actinomycetota bacterium]